MVLAPNDGAAMPREGEDVTLSWKPEDMSVSTGLRRDRGLGAADALPADRPGAARVPVPTPRPAGRDGAALVLRLGQYKGIVEEFTLKNWIEVVSDSYFLEIFLRTLRIALAVTVLSLLIGIPEAYILNRMSPPWRGIFLLIVIGPLLISLSRAPWVGPCSGLHRDLEPRARFPRTPENTRRVHVQRDRRDHRAHARPRALHDPVGVGFAPAPGPAGGERGDLPRRNSIRRAAAGGAATGRAGHSPVR